MANRLRPMVEANPQYALLSYNLACCESLTGRTAEALGHLRHAIELSEQFRDDAVDARTSTRSGTRPASGSSSAGGLDPAGV